MYEYTWYQWLLFFFIYCFFGWIIESTYVSTKSGRLVNRGFLRLPLLPLYGSGAIIMLWASLPFRSYLVLVFISGMIGASILEYVTGYVMERLFKMKYWDYSNNPFNLHGYICLGTSIAWGALTILMTEIIHKPVERVVLSMSPLTVMILAAVIGIFFIADAIESTKQALDLGRALESMTKMKGELEEIQLQIALLKAETTQKVADMRAEAIQKAANIKGETSVRITAIKAETAYQAAETVSLLKEKAEKKAEAISGAVTSIKETFDRVTPDINAGQKMASLNEKLQSITARRDKLYSHLNFYHKQLLRGNPTSSSRQFGEALRELKEKYMRKNKQS